MCGEWCCSGPRRRYRYPPARRSALGGNDSGRHPSDTSPYGSYSRVGLFPSTVQPGGRGPPLGTCEQHSLAGGPLIALPLPASVSNTPSRSAGCVVPSRPTPKLRYWPVSYTDSPCLSPWADGGYRIEADGGVISFLSDHEPALCLRNGQWPGREWVSGFDLAAGTDLLIHDAQYTDEQYDSHVGWGHSSYRHALEFASYVGAKKFIAFHHDPGHDDETLDRLRETAVRGTRPIFAVSGGYMGRGLRHKAWRGRMTATRAQLSRVGGSSSRSVNSPGSPRHSGGCFAEEGLCYRRRTTIGRGSRRVFP